MCVITPAGFEGFFEEIGALGPQPQRDIPRVMEIAKNSDRKIRTGNFAAARCLKNYCNYIVQKDRPCPHPASSQIPPASILSRAPSGNLGAACLCRNRIT